jgi:hypothetical protein
MIWKSIPSAPGYSASEEGQIRRDLLCPGTSGGVLKQNGAPYLAVAISIDGKETTRRVHTLVCEAFHGHAPPRHEVRHLDGRHHNNCEANLIWGTRKQNHADKRNHGTHRNGEKIPWSKLTAPIVVELRQRAHAGESRRRLAQQFGVAPATVSDAVTGRTWGHV